MLIVELGNDYAERLEKRERGLEVEMEDVFVYFPELQHHFLVWVVR